MSKSIASAVFLAVFILAPALPVSAGAERDVDCATDEWSIQSDKATSDLALTVTNECSDLVNAFLLRKGDVIDIGSVAVGNTRTFLIKLRRAESIRVEGNGAGDFLVTLEVQK